MAKLGAPTLQDAFKEREKAFASEMGLTDEHRQASKTVRAAMSRMSLKKLSKKRRQERLAEER